MDKTITCVDCSKQFTMTPAEQEWFKKKGLLLPKRCRDCRVAKRAKFYASPDNARH